MSDPILGRIVFGPSSDTRTPSATVDTTPWEAPRGRTITANGSKPLGEVSIRLALKSPARHVKRWIDPLSGAEVHDEVVTP